MQDVLVMADAVEQWHAGTAYAADIARTLDGSLTGAYLMPPALASVDFAPPALIHELIEICRQQSDAALRAGAAFKQWAAARGVRRSAWHVADGETLDALQAAAPWHDLLVLERGERMPWALAGQILLSVDVPCIVLPAGCERASCNTVAIAWDGSLRAARALHAAVPLLQRARYVLLIDGAESSAHDPYRGIGVEPYLREHGVGATRLRIAAEPAQAGAEILAAAANASADLLVMGAYGRARFSEWLFGGATRHVLEHARLPVLMRH